MIVRDENGKVIYIKSCNSIRKIIILLFSKPLIFNRNNFHYIVIDTMMTRIKKFTHTT